MGMTIIEGRFYPAPDRGTVKRRDIEARYGGYSAPSASSSILTSSSRV